MTRASITNYKTLTTDGSLPIGNRDDLTRYERLFAQASESSTQRLCAAISRSAWTSRLAGNCVDRHQQTIWNVGTNVAGPLLLAFTLWALDRARSQKIDRLYFLARDGEVLLEIARRICRWLGWSIECRYLYTSRQAFALPSLTGFDDNANDWILDWWEAPIIRSILADLSGDRLRRMDWDRSLTREDLKRLHAILQNMGESERILAIAQDRREVLIDYLSQEGMADGTKWALCDVGWRGSIQMCIAKITDEYSQFPPEFKGLYFGLYQKKLFVPVELTELFYTGDAGYVSKFGWLVEAFCAADHGTVEYFSRNSAGIAVPVLAETHDTDKINWGCRIQRSAITSFVDDLTGRLSLDADLVGQFIEILSQKALAAFDLMRSRPDLAEADVYGSLAIVYDVAHKRSFVAAPILRPDRLLLWLVFRHRSKVLRFWCWPEGAIRRSVGSSGLRAIFYAVHTARVLWDRFRGRSDF